MKKSFMVVAVLGLFILSHDAVRAEESAAVETAASAEAAVVTEAPVAAEAIPAAPAVETPVTPTPAAPAAESLTTDNLEFISGEISALDEAGKSVSIRLYGDAEPGAEEKTLKVEIDENTDITDGEQDRDLKSLTAGTEVDVEYDPATNKATYIFVY